MPRDTGPQVTLAWAQSLDGSLAREAGKPLGLSGPESSRMTHRLRASHEAILVGIGTVLADNPRLNVRHVEGPNPQPVILDPRLRTPPDCRLVLREDRKPWLFSGPLDSPELQQRKTALSALGCRVFEVPTSGQSGQAGQGGLDLSAVLERLGAEGIASLMVEGGAKVLAAFLASGLADRINVTIAPVLVGGLNPFAGLLLPPTLSLADPRWSALGQDMVLEAGLNR